MTSNNNITPMTTPRRTPTSGSTTNYGISGRQRQKQQRRGRTKLRNLTHYQINAKATKAREKAAQIAGNTLVTEAADPHHYVAATLASTSTLQHSVKRQRRITNMTKTLTAATASRSLQLRRTTSVAISLFTILLCHTTLSAFATMAYSNDDSIGKIIVGSTQSSLVELSAGVFNKTIVSNVNTTDVAILVDAATSPSSSSTANDAKFSTAVNFVDISLNNSNDDLARKHTGKVTINEDVDEDVVDEEQEGASEYVFDRTDVRIIFITLYTLVFCCCFFGNLLVILVVTLSRRLRSITNFFLANLALADFCVGLFCVMQNLSIYLIDSWVFGEFLCRMYQFVHSLSYTASIFILVVICMERYFAIVHPITCKQILTAARLRMVILTVWITSAVYSTPKFVFSKTIKNIHTEDGQEEEICVLDRKMFNSKLLDMINFVLLYVIPLLVMTVLYSKIAIALWRSSRGLSPHSAAHHQPQHSGPESGMGMHNSMYHHHHHHNHVNHHHVHQQISVTGAVTGGITQQSPSTPISGSSTLGGITRKQSSKYEKRGVSITESQVSLESDRPIVTACRKTSFYQHSHGRHGNSRSGGGSGNGGSGVGMSASHMSHSSSNVLRARRGVVRMLIIFVLTFALCNLPYHARKMWQYWSRSYRGDSNFNALLTPLTFLVTYFNSGVNPLLYAFLSRNFRKGMKELLLCSWKKGKSKSSSNSSMHHKRKALQTHSLPTDTTHIGNEQL